MSDTVNRSLLAALVGLGLLFEGAVAIGVVLLVGGFVLAFVSSLLTFRRKALQQERIEQYQALIEQAVEAGHEDDEAGALSFRGTDE